MSKNKDEYLVMDDGFERPLTEAQEQHMKSLDNDKDIQQKIEEFAKQMDKEFN